MIVDFYRAVMDPSLNAFRSLPKPVRLQLMIVLAYMWSVVFSICIGLIAFVGPSIVAHTLLILAILLTADVFRRARSGSLNTVRLANLALILTGHYVAIRLANTQGSK